MLYRQTISEELLEILSVLMTIEEFKTLRLVGGTSLVALQIGHRNSIDIDLFGKLEIDDIELSVLLSKNFDKVEKLTQSNSIKIQLINNIKVDIVNYPYLWLDNALLEDQIRLASLKDIAAMRVSAITNRGSKKDFIDLYFLLDTYSLSEIIDFNKEKYPDSNPYLAMKSIGFYDDADLQPMPVMYNSVSWFEIKNKISERLREII
ncbi:MAG: putative nucleotidyltransferase component of viral defense system [Saprospiraceae bacterium]|jgi:predicted nucleotidyltransferase component of viral defense system